MGRSRGNFHAEEDPSQRSRRKKNAPSGENLESVTAGQGSSDGKRALYHCNYCNKDITGRIRIKCAVCSDFDLCIECFSVGAEVHPHKSGHPYRVMDILSFPLICPEWKADEEMLLLEGIEMYGMGNWAEVAEHVGTKTKEACIEHYRSAYLNSPCFPLPDMTHVMGKNRKELLAMAKGHIEDKKGELQLKEESPFSPSRVKIEDQYKSGPPGRLPSNSIPGAKVNKKLSNTVPAKDHGDVLKMEGRSFGVNKPKSAKVEGPSLLDSSGYNPKRQEFDPEYDNEAEQLLADMEFKETDTDEEHQLKLRVLRIYSKRLDERKRRKDFILERNLLHPSPFDDFSHEEKELCRRYDVFMRFHSKDEHEELLKTVVSEHRILKRIRELKEARAAGCRSSAEADRYLEQKRREGDDVINRKENSQAGPSSQESLSVSDSFGTYSTTTSAGQANSWTDSDFVPISGANLLSESEKQLCRDIRLSPQHYLKIQEDLTTQILCGNITKKSDAHSFFQVEQMKIDRVYDILLRKGIAHL
ncbi:transcriptional adapter ADA2b isoform X1 [Salvia hispanica]|uniref:transcriptional adapter ADA2b isoform X1 n=1 Tax=Salvia hispanica TaxID=49212 RepID=UPI0020093259|nr:transcriptional adapter ADA2b isoform X1 [Salvia hispanica]XP_047946604.1 transcriptional adapter ADA2b isoform X1 [Salvia hispanica]XP_047946605.1 transcriptional adapter ADA2b isoform X1 [Salvia hispanica]